MLEPLSVAIWQSMPPVIIRGRAPPRAGTPVAKRTRPACPLPASA